MAELITIPDQDLEFVEDIELDFRRQYNREPVKFPQYDSNTRYIRATLKVDGQIYQATSSQIITFSATKADGYGIFNPAGIDSQGRVIYEITEQTTNCIGTFPACFTIYDNKVVSGVTVTRRKALFNFKIHVAKSALSDNTIISSNEFKALTDAMATLGDLIVDGNAIFESLTLLEGQVEDAEAIRVESENERISDENERKAHDAVRPIWEEITWTQYNDLTEEEKLDLLKFRKISDSENAQELVDELQNLINATNAAKNAAEQVVISQNNINDSAINSIQTWSSYQINRRIRCLKYTTTSTTSSITHGLNYSPTTDYLEVIYNGLILEEGINYTNSSDFHTINFSSWTVPIGNNVYFKLFKYVK